MPKHVKFRRTDSHDEPRRHDTASVQAASAPGSLGAARPQRVRQASRVLHREAEEAAVDPESRDGAQSGRAWLRLPGREEDRRVVGAKALKLSDCTACFEIYRRSGVSENEGNGRP